MTHSIYLKRCNHFLCTYEYKHHTHMHINIKEEHKHTPTHKHIIFILHLPIFVNGFYQFNDEQNVCVLTKRECQTINRKKKTKEKENIRVHMKTVFMNEHFICAKWVSHKK